VLVVKRTDSVRKFNKQKTTNNQLFQVFLDDFIENLSSQAGHVQYRQNKIKEYHYLKTM
jgi:hypothetical protein